VDIASMLDWLQRSSLAVQIRDSLFAFPLIESTHVIGLTLVFGTIAIVDLRLLGVASSHRSFQRLASDVLKWTWAAFALTALTGGLMFITNAAVYFHNAYFRAKVVLLVLAAINVLVFELTTGRTVEQWDDAPSAPPLGRAIATASLVIWVAVIVTGRMIGFTTTRASLAEPAPVETNFEDLLGLPGDSGDSTPPTPPTR
jgi:Family of unknown function (DUF6644)